MGLFNRRRPQSEFGWFPYAPDASSPSPQPHSQPASGLWVTVDAHQRVVVRKRRVVTGVLGPGRHWVGLGVSVVRIDMRERREQLAPQEVPTADGALVKVTVSFAWRVDDPIVFVEISADPKGEVYLAVQVALREALIGREIDELAAAPRLDPSIVDGLATRASEVARDYGMQVDGLVVKDVILPAEWRRAMLAIKTAKLDGLAKLEAARADTAALRALSNQAKLLEDHPELAKLQLMKAAAASGRLQLSYAPFE